MILFYDSLGFINIDLGLLGFNGNLLWIIEYLGYMDFMMVGF